MLAQSIILGIVQGLTEFLPISSSGHLVIFKSYLHADTQGAVWEISLHLGTLLAGLGFNRCRPDSSQNVKEWLQDSISDKTATVSKIQRIE